jgi:integrase
VSFRTQRDLDRLTLPTGKAEVFHFDARCPGLSVRIQRTGKPAFVAWYTVPGGKRKRLTLGPVAGLELDVARRQAAEISNAARNGRDPSMERKQARLAAADVFTLGDLIGAYLRDHAERHQRPRTLVETRRALERHWLPLHGLSAADVTRRDVSARLLELARSSGTVGANRARANLSACFAWAMRAGLVDVNPVVGTVKGEEASRERVLALDELKAIWRATADLDNHDCIIRMLLLSGQRRQEVGGMAWAELSSDDRSLWTLPPSRAKNGRAHEIPLSRQAQAIIAELPQSPGRPYVFGRGGRGPFSGWSRCKERLDARIAAQQGAPIADWHTHDLRRSAVTHMSEFGIAPPHIIEAVVGHVSGHQGGIAGVYNRAVYRGEKAVALQRWADWLEELVEAREPVGKVVALRG